MCELSPVSFHGDTIFCIDYQNQPYTPAKPIVENMGLTWQAQAAKLTANKGRWGITIIVIPSKSGDQQTLCLPVRKLPAYLASINPKKVRPELRERIELYQAESDDALWNYWINGRAERPASEPTRNSCELSPTHRSELKSLVDAKLSAFPASVQGKARSEIWSRFNRHFRIAEYAQLPIERMAEARDYLIELQPKALAALPASPLASLDESSCLSLAESFSAAHRQIKELSRALRIRMYAVETTIEENLVRAGYYGRKGNGCPLGNALSGYLAAMCDQALLYPGDELPADRNPGYLLRDIVEQVTTGMRAWR